MTIHLHLFSRPGRNDLGYILEACRPYLEGKSDPLVAYLPLASLYAQKWLGVSREAFKGLAQVEMIDAESMTSLEMEAVLRRAHVAYVSGGNTFLLSHRLTLSNLLPHLRKKVQAGLPLVGFSAGAIICGPNILTSKDMNAVKATSFAGLNLVPFNLFVHYADDEYGQAQHDDWLSDYHVFQDNPVIVMADNAYIRVEGKKTILVHGDAWLLRKGQEKEKIDPGVDVTL